MSRSDPLGIFVSNSPHAETPTQSALHPVHILSSKTAPGTFPKRKKRPLGGEVLPLTTGRLASGRDRLLKVVVLLFPATSGMFGVDREAAAA